MLRLARRLPLVETLFTYRRAWLVPDLVGWLSACVVMVPSVLAYAEVAGLPPLTGLYAALAGLVGYALLASARQVIAGPDAALSLLAAVSIAPLAQAHPEAAPALAAALALLTGGVLLLAALLRAGVVADLLSKPVLVGYLTGAALILAGTQLGRFFGIPLEESRFFPMLVELARRLPEAHGVTLWLGLGLVALQVVLGLVAPRWPGALVVFVLALLGSWAFDLRAHGVAMVGHVEAGLPMPAWPQVGYDQVVQLVPGALAMALLTVPEGVLLARAFAARRGDTVRPNQEIAALGVANLAASLLQGFSVGASQSRTAVNAAAGAATQLSSLVAAAGVAAFLLLLTPLLALLPGVALGAILIYAGARLIDVGEYRALTRFRTRSLVLALTVAAGVLVFGVLQGILLGVAISLVFAVGRMARPMDSVLQRIPSARRYHDLGDEGDSPRMTAPGVVAYRFYAPIMFANAEWFADRVAQLVSTAPEPVRLFVLDAQAITEIDATGADTLMRALRNLRAQGIEVRIARANRPLREILGRVGAAEVLGRDGLAPSVHAAVNGFLDREGSTDAPL